MPHADAVRVFELELHPPSPPGALGNAGVWCVGRLQTDADRERVVDGLAANDDRIRAALHATVQRLAPRWFVLRNLHDGGEPVLLQPRHAMSFLRGPMTRAELRRAVAAKARAPWIEQ